MAAECFIPKVFTLAHRVEIRRAREIIEEFAQQGFHTFTVRSLYYQFVSRDYIPNSLKSYKRLADILNDARLAGEIDWDNIGDNVRNLETPPSWEGPLAMMDSAAKWFRRDPWEPHDVRIEIWVEKDAILGFVEPICRRFRVPHFACRGFTSQSEAYAAGRRFADYAAERKRVLILHLGDHDPSGIDMSRDNENRLRMFSELGDFEYRGTCRAQEDGEMLEFRRIALNMDQIRRYKPPPNPAKMSDSRARGENGYIAVHGRQSWELDALSPTAIDEIISAEIEPEIDQEIWDRILAEEKIAQNELKMVRKNWTSIMERPWTKKRPEEVREEAVEIVRDNNGGELLAGMIEEIEVKR